MVLESEILSSTEADGTGLRLSVQDPESTAKLNLDLDLPCCCYERRTSPGTISDQ